MWNCKYHKVLHQSIAEKFYTQLKNHGLKLNNFETSKNYLLNINANSQIVVLKHKLNIFCFITNYDKKQIYFSIVSALKNKTNLLQ
jgi:hypothetical protein